MPFPGKRESVLVRKEMTVQNRHGLHARPASEFVRHVLTFKSEIAIIDADGRRFNAGRIIDILLPNLGEGTVFTLEALGPDADEAIKSLESVLAELKN